MAQSPRRRRRQSGSRSGGRAHKPAVVADGAAVVAIGLALGLSLALSPGFRAWGLESLAYGWAPVGLWIIGVVAGLRYYPHNLIRNWRWWGVGASAAALAVGVLSLLHPNFGTLADVSLGGRWGSAVGGSPLTLAIGKLVVIAAVTPVVFFPRKAGYIYAHGFGGIGAGLGALARLPQLLRSSGLGAKFGLGSRASSGVGVDQPTESTLADSSPQIQPADVALAGRDAVSSDQEATISAWQPIEEFLAQERKLSASGGVVEAAWTWISPPADLLAVTDVPPVSEDALNQMARLIESTLASHGVSVEVKDIQAGPRLVRFGLDPGWLGQSVQGDEGESGWEDNPGNRVRVQSILARDKDLALALKSPSIRIQPTIPGEALVGLEVPSPNPRTVGLKEVIESDRFGDLIAAGGLPIALGQDISSEPIVLDLADLPHLLLAGATGTGKSVCLNSIAASLLFANSPDRLRLVMVDPKGVELTPYNRVPHLIGAAITDQAQFDSALGGLLVVMRDRYSQLQQAGVRNIRDYNASSGRTMPYIVLLVDELAELMLAGGRDVEANLVRLAQMGRATGIHLVLATQRPTVDVVTGLIKANISTRIAFAVASQTDSRVILDVGGAESLLGRGDMLLLDKQSPQPRRIQGTLVTDSEVSELVQFWQDPARSRAEAAGQTPTQEAATGEKEE